MRKREADELEPKTTGGEPPPATAGFEDVRRPQAKECGRPLSQEDKRTNFPLKLPEGNKHSPANTLSLAREDTY
jgi:hypothetical protein